DTPTVLAAVRDALEAAGHGLLQPESQGIGNTLFRSAIFETVLAVPGALAVSALTLDGEPFEPYGRNPGSGRYFDFEGALSVTGSPSNGCPSSRRRRLRGLLHREAVVARARDLPHARRQRRREGRPPRRDRNPRRPGRDPPA